MTKRVNYVGSQGGNSSETEEIFDLLNYTPDNTKQITITPDINGSGACNANSNNGYDSDYTIVFYDVSVSGTWAYDTSATTSGDETSCSSPCNLSGVSITPGTSLGILFANASIQFNSVIGVTSPWIGDVVWPPILYQYPAWDQNNGWAHYENTDTTTRSTSWTMADTGMPTVYWASAAASYKATVASGGETQSQGEIQTRGEVTGP